MPRHRSNANGDPDLVGVTGHAPDSPGRDEIAAHRDPPASDDGAGAFVAIAAAPSAAAGANRDPYAEAAEAEAHTKRSRKTGTAPRSPGKTTDSPAAPKAIPPGRNPLPADAAAFAAAVHAKADFVRVGKKLLNSMDEKIAQRAWEKMLEMTFGKGTTLPADDDTGQVIPDLRNRNRSEVQGNS
jgi:hypothetical protein